MSALSSMNKRPSRASQARAVPDGPVNEARSTLAAAPQHDELVHQGPALVLRSARALRARQTHSGSLVTSAARLRRGTPTTLAR